MAFKNNYIFIILSALILTLIETFGQYNLKEYTLKNNIYFYLFGLLLYIISATIFMNLLSHEKIGVINLIWNIISTLFVFTMGYIIFKESINKYEMVGIIFAVISIILLGLK